MKKSDITLLTEKFGTRVSFDKTEMLLYSHDTASLPGIIRRLFNPVPAGVVLPVTAEEVIFIIKFARERNIPLTPRGAASSGWGGVLPTRGGIVVSFARMRRILEIDTAKGLVRAEPGVIWKNLDYELNKSGLALRIYPSSALSATVGGWVAEGGGGIGSYEYKLIGDNIESVQVVIPDGTLKTFSGEDLDLITEAEGITGLITEVTVKTRPYDADVPILASFNDMKHLINSLDEVNQASLPLWHVTFSNTSFVARQHEAEADAVSVKPHFGESPEPPEAPQALKCCRALFVYPGTRETAIKQRLLDIIGKNHGQLESATAAAKEWGDRFYPIRLKRLGPSLISSEAIVSVPTLRVENVVEDIEKKFPDISITVTMLSHENASILGNLLSDERSPNYTLEFPRSLEIIDTACRYGGCPYSTGLYFTTYANRTMGKEKVARVAKFKQETDPAGLLNPGKILPGNRNPGLLRFLLWAAKTFRPFIRMGRPFFSRKPKLYRQIPPQLMYEAYACAQCGYCIDVCDQYFGRQWESETTRGRWYFLRQYMEGKAQFNQMMLDSFLLCTTCQRCNQVCQVQIPIQQMWDRMRGLVIQEKGYHTFPGFEMMGSSFTRQLNIWAGARSERDKWLPADVKPLAKGSVGYWAGCTASYVENDIAQNAVHILKEGGVDFTYLGREEACCGIPFYAAGKWDLFAAAVRHNITELNKRGIETLVLSCPGCWVTLNHYYREWAPKLGLEYKIKVKHITEVAAELLKEGKLKFKQSPKDGGRLTYHDPCHIGRHAGIYEPPRELLRAIPGIELVEMEHHRENGLCCGSVLSRVGRPPAADAIGAMRIAEAEKVNAGIVLTACPCCEVQLRVGARFKKSNVRVLDISDVIVEALGYEVKDPTHTVLDAWDVFGTAIDMMTVKGMADMMTQMLPEVMAAMPGYMKSMMGMMTSLPSTPRHAMLAMMRGMIPILMPRLLPGMLPKLMPKATEMMEQAIPNMPPAMKAMLPELLSEVMAAIMPPMLPGVAPLIAPKMTDYLEQQAINKK